MNNTTAQQTSSKRTVTHDEAESNAKKSKNCVEPSVFWPQTTSSGPFGTPTSSVQLFGGLAPNGQLCVLTLSNGNKLNGQYKDGQFYVHFENKCTLKYPNGDVLTGNCQNGKFVGTCSFKRALSFDGFVLIGEYKDGQFVGQCTKRFTNGNQLFGEHAQLFGEQNIGQLIGQCTMIFTNGDRLTGKYIKDQFVGQCTETYPNGDQLVGEYKNDVFVGHCVLTLANGDVISGAITFPRNFDKCVKTAIVDGVTKSVFGSYKDRVFTAV